MSTTSDRPHLALAKCDNAGAFCCETNSLYHRIYRVSHGCPRDHPPVAAWCTGPGGPQSPGPISRQQRSQEGVWSRSNCLRCARTR
jgi:hypothetical protein